MFHFYGAKAEECWVSGGVRVWLVQEEEAERAGSSSHNTGSAQEGDRSSDKKQAQVPPSVSLQAVSWFLDGSDLEMQATEMLPRRHCGVLQTVTPTASAAPCIHLLTTVSLISCLLWQALPWPVCLQRRDWQTGTTCFCE